MHLRECKSSIKIQGHASSTSSHEEAQPSKPYCIHYCGIPTRIISTKQRSKQRLLLCVQRDDPSSSIISTTYSLAFTFLGSVNFQCGVLLNTPPLHSFPTDHHHKSCRHRSGTPGSLLFLVCLFCNDRFSKLNPGTMPSIDVPCIAVPTYQSTLTRLLVVGTSISGTVNNPMEIW